MAELLTRLVDNPNEFGLPYKAGDVVFIAPDDWAWGPREKGCQLVGETPVSIVLYAPGAPTAYVAIINQGESQRRIKRIKVEDLSQAEIDAAIADPDYMPTITAAWIEDK
jgi:hypothetical protein